jgi:hypothetical protein
MKASFVHVEDRKISKRGDYYFNNGFRVTTAGSINNHRRRFYVTDALLNQEGGKRQSHQIRILVPSDFNGSGDNAKEQLYFNTERPKSMAVLTGYDEQNGEKTARNNLAEFGAKFLSTLKITTAVDYVGTLPFWALGMNMEINKMEIWNSKISPYNETICFKNLSGRVHNNVPYELAEETAIKKVQKLTNQGPDWSTKMKSMGSVKVNKDLLERGTDTYTWENHRESVLNVNCRESENQMEVKNGKIRGIS